MYPTYLTGNMDNVPVMDTMDDMDTHTYIHVHMGVHVYSAIMHACTLGGIDTLIKVVV